MAAAVASTSVVYAWEAAAAGAVHGLHAQCGDQPLLFLLQPLALVHHLRDKNVHVRVRSTEATIVTLYECDRSAILILTDDPLTLWKRHKR